jgi:indole-3-glycerol phosphate synthase
MDILQDILSYKKDEVEKNRALFPVKLLEQSMYFETPCVSLASYLNRSDLVGVIAEIKRKSPSKGVINPYISVEQLSVGYMQAGASALSILTDTKYFGGTGEDLKIARRFNFCPILRKDFIVDEYQIVEAKALGADVVLLIAAALTNQQIRLFSGVAHTLGLEVLLEVRSEAELEVCSDAEIDLVGVNNRDLADFSIDTERALRLAEKIPANLVKIAESGISNPATVRQLRKAGFRGFLIGEHFMKHEEPELACKRFIQNIAGGE